MQPTCNHPFRPGLIANKPNTLLGLNNAQMTTVLENVGRSEILNHSNVMQFAGGSPGDAIAYHDQLQSIPQSILQQLIQPPSNLLTALSIAKDIEMQLDFHQQLGVQPGYLQFGTRCKQMLQKLI